MVPEAFPKVYFRVCVKEEDALVIVIVRVVPMSVEAADDVTVDALAIVSSVNADVLDPLMEFCPPPGITPAEEMENVIVPVANDFDPSELCAIVVVPDATTSESFLDMLCCVGSLE